MTAARSARRKPPPVAAPVVEEPEHSFEVVLMQWKHPDYAGIIKQRLRNLDRLREHPEEVPAIKAYYKDHLDDFINDWGWTYDPRNAEINLPTMVPLILFSKQREWIHWVIERWMKRERGLTEKSRDVGISWTAMSLGCSIGIHYDGVAIGVGSRKTEYVDKIGTYKPLLPKGRFFMENLPAELRGGYVAWRDAPFMRISIPDTGSLIAGEGGDDLGRGDRTAIYLVDEYAHFERPQLTEASLSMTTNCRIDMSSVRGRNNPFAEKRHSGKVPVFIFDWRDDPRKDDAWYAKQTEELDPIVVAQEIDRDYLASVQGVVIPARWAKACIDAKKRLGIAPSGIKGVALDVADEGVDKNAAAVCEGTTVLRVVEWSGKGGDIFESVEQVFRLCDEHGADFFEYDADGLGAGVRGDARIINERRKLTGERILRAIGHRGSEAVHDPDGIVEGTIGREGDKGRLKKDYYMNRKAQSWFEVRRRCRNTYRWIVEGKPCPPDDILDISSADPKHMQTVDELSQATYKTNPLGKIVINKKPDGSKSPNKADAVVIRYAPKDAPPMRITEQALQEVRATGIYGRRRIR